MPVLYEVDEEEAEGESAGWNYLADVVYHDSHFVIAFWVVVTLISSGFAPKLLDRVKLVDWGAPAGTPSVTAGELFAEHFAMMMDAKTETVLVSCAQPCETVVGELSQGIVEKMEAVIKGFNADYPGTVIHQQSYYSYGDALKPNPLLSVDKQGLLFQWTWHIPLDATHSADLLVVELMEQIDKLNAELVGLIHIGATGPTVLKRAVMLTMGQDMSHHDLLCLPFALCILAFRIKSFKLLPLPVMCIALSILTSFAATYAYSFIGPVSQIAPTIMLLLCIALSLDYSLFMLSRFVEERINGCDVEESLRHSLSSSGTVVLLSGTVLMVAYGAMLFLPGAVKSISFSSCSAILCSILIQVTFLPAIISMVPFFQVYAEYEKSHQIEGNDTERDIVSNGVPDDIYSEDVEENAIESVVKAARPFAKGMWFVWGGKLTTFPLNLVVPLVLNLVFFPATLRFLQYQPVIDFPQTIPQHRRAWLTNLEIQRNFKGGMGCSFPVFIMSSLEGPYDGANVLATASESKGFLNRFRNQNVLSTLDDVRKQSFFDATCRMANGLINATAGKPYALHPENFLSVTFHNGIGNEVVCNNYGRGKLFRTSFFTRGMVGAKMSEEVWIKTVSKGHHAMITLLYPSVDIFSADAFELVRELRKILKVQSSQETFRAHSGVTFTTHSATGVLMDNVDVTMQRLPWCFGATVFLSFVLIAVTFGALLIPIKLFFTVGLPITWTYGMALFVYADGMMNFLPVAGLQSDGGLNWLSPVCTCTVVLGLALDYDIFLFARIWEFRQEGFNDKESIQLGLSATGPIITSAGLIFGITFSGMVFSQIPLNNQLGFIFVFGLLADTFLVRTALVPSVLSMWPVLNWWPVAMPKPEYTAADDKGPGYLELRQSTRTVAVPEKRRRRRKRSGDE